MAFPVLAAASLRTAITTKLPQLQNLIKRDPGGYIEEFLQQNRHFQSELAIVRLDPTKRCEKGQGIVQSMTNFGLGACFCCDFFDTSM
jgi:protein SDA1